MRNPAIWGRGQTESGDHHWRNAWALLMASGPGFLGAAGCACTSGDCTLDGASTRSCSNRSSQMALSSEE
ncbi:hypothetical protein KUCAC02_028808, partial [Chaenocephalus aceratus]